MKKNEAIMWLEHIKTREIGWDEYAMQESLKEIRERCEQSIRDAISMAINALKEQKEWKYVEKDGNPKIMGTYYCLVVAPLVRGQVMKMKKMSRKAR